MSNVSLGPDESLGALDALTREFAERVEEIRRSTLATPTIEPRPIVETEGDYDGEAVGDLPDFVQIMFDQETGNLEDAFGVQVNPKEQPEPEPERPEKVLERPKKVLDAPLQTDELEEPEWAETEQNDEEEVAPRRMPNRRRIQFDDTTPRTYVNNRRSTMEEIIASALKQRNRFAEAGGTTKPVRPTPPLTGFGSPSTRLQYATMPRASTLTPKSVQSLKTVTIDGRPLTIKSTPTDVHCLQPVRTWNKLERKDLDSETKQLFVKSATGYVLTKSNKLTVFSMQDADDDKLKQLNSLQTQLKLLRAHMQNYDILDVFTIVVPSDVMKTPILTDYYFDLLRDYAKLDDSVVANSCAWYNMWVREAYVQENMAYTYTLLQNNTTESLWNKCLEEYEEYAPSQQGGPLMFFLIIRRIQSNSETAIEHLKKQIKNLKLRDLPGENVDTVVSLIKTTYQALENASTPEHTYIPEDFPQTVLKVLQTSSVRRFNDAFDREETQVRHEANKFGGRPQWPPLNQILNLATNTYHEMQAENTWNVSSQSKKRAYLGSTPSGSGASSAPKRFKLLCWNCGEEGHGLRDCKEDRNEANIEKNKQKFQALKRKYDSTKGKSNGKSGDKPKRKTGSDGKPYVLNKKGAYVLDQKSLSSEKKKVEVQKEFESTLDALEKAAAAPAAESVETPAQVNVASHLRTPGLHAQMSALRAAAKKLIS